MDRPSPKQADAVGDGVDLDKNVVEKLPPGSKVLSVTPSGTSLWVSTVRITTELPDGTIVSYFKKGATGVIGANMMEGTFAAEQAIYDAIPQHVPKPLAWGVYASQPDTYFYICEFIDMSDDVPSARQWARAVAALHSATMGKSPTGQFGFPLVTHLANVPMDNTWNPSWEQYWVQQMKSLLDQEEALHGTHEEFTQLKEKYFSKVIPRLLRPLETGGRNIQPCIIHSDLWPGNIKPKVGREDVCMFDGCSYWGHNEADLGVCRNPRYRLGKSYIEEYSKQIPISEPYEDFDDRNALYALKYHVLLSIMYKEPRYRRIAVGEMKRLVQKFDDAAIVDEILPTVRNK